MIGYTTIGVSDMERAKTFYCDLFADKGAKVVKGELPKIMLSVIIALAVLREGAEIVLFTYSMLASGKDLQTVLTGSFAGLFVGGLLGGAIYFGMVRIPTKYIFQVSTWVLIFLTAGMASLAAKYLVMAGYFDSMSAVIVNLSPILSEKSIVGQILHALFGYSERPMVIQGVFYFATLGFFIAMMYLFKDKPKDGKLETQQQPS